MIYRVTVSDQLVRAITAAFGPNRSVGGRPSEWDFWGGPLAAALVAFRDFDTLRFEHVPEIRYYDYVDPVFGPIVFVGINVALGTVELAAYASDADYWNLIDGDPVD